MGFLFATITSAVGIGSIWKFPYALFAGWAIPDRMLIEELGLSPAGGRVLRSLLRYVAPAAIAATAVSAVFSY